MLTPGRACWDHRATSGAGVVLNQGWTQGYRERSLGMPGKPGGDSFAELYVEAGKPLALMFTKGNGGEIGCEVSLAFTPKEGEDYEASVSLFKKSSDETLCIAGVHSLTSEDRVEYTGAPECK